MSEIDIREERLKKLAMLKKEGMETYPVSSNRTKTIADFISRFDESLANSKKETLVGRVMSLRRQGGIIFADIFDGSTPLTTGGTARIQAVLQKSEMKEANFNLFSDTVDASDFIEVSGIAYVTKRGERSIKASLWRMLSKSLMPIPTEWYGIKDEELRLRERHLDLLLNKETREIFERKAKFWSSARDFYLARGFLEVETPVLETSPGGADARPFATHHNALDIEVFMRICAGELWQKRLLIAGFPKVFEIGRIFRNEGQSREHLQDYTQLESYEAFKDMRDGMKFVQELYRHIAKETYKKYSFKIGEYDVDFAEEWPVIDFCEKIMERFGVDALEASEAESVRVAKDAGVTFGDSPNRIRAIDHLWKLIRKGIGGPAFLVGVPAYLEPLAKRVPGNENLVERVQVIIAGSEIGKGFSELNDPIDQRARFEDQQRLRDLGDEEAQRLDLDYVRAMEYGMPPAFGFGVSERLFSFFENKPIHVTQLFPLLRPKKE